MQDIRDRMVAEVARGRTFVDIGGLYGIVRERASIAHQAGAKHVSLMDMEPPSCPWWAEMDQHLRGRGVSEFSLLSRDIHDYKGPRFDVVFSSGVLYHVPDPLGYLRQVVEMANEYCIVASTICPAVMEMPEGTVRVPEAGTLFIPALDGTDRTVVEAFMHRHGRPGFMTGAGTRDFRNYYPNWWLPTKEAFVAMCRVAGIEVMGHDYIETDVPVGYAVLGRVVRQP
ncbi:MAG TPA: hypothetical protein VN329_06710 [Roseomonas sp.]|nr:hypothetical protein [Roseomonas sp.]